MATESWAPKRKSSESNADYKKRYYTAQRVHAEETGDQKTTDKIYAKAGKASHSVDSNKVDKDILGGVASIMASRIPGARAVGTKALTGNAKALTGGRTALGPARARGTANTARVNRTKAAGPPKALTGGKAASSSSPSSVANAAPKPPPKTVTPVKPPLSSTTIRKGAAADKEIARGKSMQSVATKKTVSSKKKAG